MRQIGWIHAGALRRFSRTFSSRFSVGQITSDFQKSCPAPEEKYSASRREITDYLRRPGPHEGRSRSSRNVGLGCDGRFGVRRVFRAGRKRRRRTAKSCGPGAAMLAPSLAGSIPPMTVTTSPLHRGEHEVSRKAIAQGMSECFRSPVCSCAPIAQFLAHETAGAACTRHSLRPLSREEQRICKASGEIAPRERGMSSLFLRRQGSIRRDRCD